MPTDHRARLASIRRFDQLVDYLRDELDWPITSEHFEELTFEYTPEELGIDAKNAAKIQEIRRLRPLVPGQPWGIFFVKFEPKRLPVVALRRILGRVTLRKRASANWSERQAWAADDLLFVSNYGERNERRIAFAHFSRPQNSRDLPTLKVLGWDNRDTPLHLDAIARELTENLAWPEDEKDLDSWRECWRSAFALRHRQVITTSKQLSERLAEVARAIRDRTLVALEIETQTGPLTTLLKAFQTTLVHDLDEAKFADMYAQTITYGLLSARITDPSRRTADDLASHMRTNPFLRELMVAFLGVGGRGGAGGPDIDFDELGVSEVVDLLDRANMEAVVRDFGDRNPQEDPVIHFYEHFLEAYDKTQKVEAGVFYTPRSVVTYIVRSVDETLRKDFGLTDGLADTTTWGEMVALREGLEVPEGTPSDQPFVQILDPAAGTGTFLVEAIDSIRRTMARKWRGQGHGDRKIEALWNDYVPEHLLPRLHGYELLMAPYAIAHLKIGLKLYETGYRFESDERARVYLTNALEPPRGEEQFTLDLLPALAHEAAAVNGIKRTRRFTVVIGNPPYLGEAGRGGEWIAALMRGVELPSKRRTLSYFEVDGKPLGEKNPKWVNDLYVRFTRLSQHLIGRSGAGVHGFITNHGYIDNPTFRGMRWALLSAFDRLTVLDLHGSTKKKEVPPDGGSDENVFDIEQGVAIGLFVKHSAGRTSREKAAASRVRHSDLWGARAGKYGRLLEGGALLGQRVEPRPKFFLLRPFAGDDAAEYGEWASVTEVLPVKSVGIVTARDALTVRWSTQEIWGVVREMAEGETEALRSRYGLGKDVRDWKVAWAQRDLRRSGPSEGRIAPILYRPFDTRYTYYTGASRGFLCYPRADVMGHMLAGENYAVITARSNKFPRPDHFFCSRTIVETKCGESSTQSTTFPLYLYPGVARSDELLFSPWPKGKDGRRPNLDPGFVERLAEATGLRFVPDGSGDLRATFGPEDVLANIYAVFHSPGFRERYEAHLKLDFPRVPPCASGGLFRDLARAGHALLALHTLASPRVGRPITTYTGPRNLEVGRVGWSDGTVWLNAVRTIAREGHRATKPGTAGFRGIPEEVWDFRVGGYQVCHKWLKDRKGRRLSDEDVAHYQRIVVALNETLRIMAEIDQAIEVHGGWPEAFETASEPAGERPAASD